MSIEVETVPEVMAVHRQAVKVEFCAGNGDDPAMILLSHQQYGWGDLQFISFPADKAEALIEAIRAEINQRESV